MILLFVKGPPLNAMLAANGWGLSAEPVAEQGTGRAIITTLQLTARDASTLRRIGSWFLDDAQSPPPLPSGSLLAFQGLARAAL